MRKILMLITILSILATNAQAECIAGDCINGYGTYAWTSGKYVGEYKDGKSHGQGILILTNGAKYVGEFKNGKRHGQGIYTDSKGTKYTGEYKDGKENGQGTLIWKSGKKYVGEFKNGKRHGQGIATWENGGKYVGEWKDGEQYEPNFVGVGIEIIKEKEEVMIVAVLHESPASKIGLKVGDVIVSVNGLKLSKTLKLYEVASLIKGPVDSTVEITVRRKDKIKDTAYKIVRKQITNI